jgi:hypothetical protein
MKKLACNIYNNMVQSFQICHTYGSRFKLIEMENRMINRKYARALLRRFF